MSIRGLRTFKDYCGTLKEVNKLLKKPRDIGVQIGTLGGVKVKFKIKKPGGKPLEMNLNRNELAKYVTSLAMKMENPEKAKELLETFKERMVAINEKVEIDLSFNDSKRVKAGRKLASFSKHFFDRDKNIEKTLAKLQTKIDNLPKEESSSSAYSSWAE